MYKNFNLTDQERQQIMEMHTSHGYRKPMNESSKTNAFVNEQSKVDPKRSAFFDNLAKVISSKIVGKKYSFGKIGVLDNTNIIVTRYNDRNHAINLAGEPVKELNLYFNVRRVEEDLYKNEKPGTRVWTGLLSVTANFVNGKLSPNPLVELYPDFNGKTDFNGKMVPSKPLTWDMLGGANLWSNATKMNQQQSVVSEQHQPSNFKQGQVVKAKRDIDNNVYTIKIIKSEQNYLYGTVMGPGNYQNQSLKNGLNVELYSDKPGVISGNQQLGKFTVV